MLLLSFLTAEQTPQEEKLTSHGKCLIKTCMLTYNLVQVANENCDRGHHKFQLLKVKTNSHCKLHTVHQVQMTYRYNACFFPSYYSIFLSRHTCGVRLYLSAVPKCVFRLYMFLSFSFLFILKFLGLFRFFPQVFWCVFPVLFFIKVFT